MVYQPPAPLAKTTATINAENLVYKHQSATKLFAPKKKEEKKVFLFQILFAPTPGQVCFRWKRKVCRLSHYARHKNNQPTDQPHHHLRIQTENPKSTKLKTTENKSNESKQQPKLLSRSVGPAKGREGERERE